MSPRRLAPHTMLCYAWTKVTGISRLWASGEREGCGPATIFNIAFAGAWCICRAHFGMLRFHPYALCDAMHDRLVHMLGPRPRLRGSIFSHGFSMHSPPHYYPSRCSTLDPPRFGNAASTGPLRCMVKPIAPIFLASSASLNNILHT